MAAPMLAPMPGSLDMQANYTLRIVALDATTGSTVAGVNIGQSVITATNIGSGASADLAQGSWFLVPGPNA